MIKLCHHQTYVNQSSYQYYIASPCVLKPCGLANWPYCSPVWWKASWKKHTVQTFTSSWTFLIEKFKLVWGLDEVDPSQASHFLEICAGQRIYICKAMSHKHVHPVSCGLIDVFHGRIQYMVCMTGEHILHSGAQLCGLTSRAFDAPWWQICAKAGAVSTPTKSWTIWNS